MAQLRNKEPVEILTHMLIKWKLYSEIMTLCGQTLQTAQHNRQTELQGGQLSAK